jgi:hypothetical protein
VEADVLSSQRPPEVDDPPRRLPRPRALVTAAAVSAAVIACFVLCLAQSFTSSVNSDTAGIALQGWDLWHGNPLLHGWYASDAPFYTLETPLNALVQMVMGLNATTLHVVSAITYTMVIVAAAWLAASGARGAAAYARAGLAAALLAVPLCAGDLAGLLLETPNHIGTSVFLLLAFLIYSRVPGRRAAFGLLALLVVGQIGDATVRYVAVTTLVAVTLVRMLAARRLVIPETWAGVAAAASVPCAIGVRAVMRSLGAFSMIHPATQIAPAGQWLNHLGATGESLIRLFNIDVSDPIHVTPGWLAGQILGGAALLAGAYGLCRTAWRWRRGDAADQLLAVSVLIYPATYAFSTMVRPGSHGAYEFVGVLPLIAVLAARNLPMPSRGGHRALAWTSIATAVALLLSGVFKPADVTRSEHLAAWLKAHGFRYGISGYWDATSTTADSGNAVGVRAVINIGGQYAIYPWVTNGSWYDPARYDANFVIADNGSPGITVADVEKIYGVPAAQYPVVNRMILVYHVNLFKTLNVPPHPDY